MRLPLRSSCFALAGAWLLPTSARAQQSTAPGHDAPPSAQELAELRERLRALENRLEHGETPGSTASPGDYQPEKVPFAWGDFRWMPGNYAPRETPLKFGAFTGEVRVDTAYHWSFADPQDNTIAGSSEVFRHGELQLTQLGFGGDFYYRGVQARFMTQFGMYSQTTPRNDASPSRGQWHLDDGYRYISEAYAGYHIDAMEGINVQAGIFMSYIGLWSYYNFDNWTYQPSYVSSNTPWFFEGVRAQVFVSDRLKIEPWLINGWQ